MLREMGLAQYLKFCVRSNGSWHYGKDLPKQTITSFAALQGSFQRPKKKSISLGLWIV